MVVELDFGGSAAGVGDRQKADVVIPLGGHFQGIIELYALAAMELGCR